MKADRRCRLLAKRAMKQAGIDIGPRLETAIADQIAEACTEERARLAGMLLSAHDHYGPLTDDRIRVLASLFEVHLLDDDGTVRAPPGFDDDGAFPRRGA